MQSCCLLWQVILRYETALELWNRFITVQEEVRVWVESKITMVVSLQSKGITHEQRAQIQVSEAALPSKRLPTFKHNLFFGYWYDDLRLVYISRVSSCGSPLLVLIVV